MEITILDNKYDSETTAMLQAFYSRNHKPIKVRLEELGEDQTSVKKNLEKWYVGYGHESIGQCGGFTLFIENVSFLAAKAIQDSPLYNGQESSSRYIDFYGKEMINLGFSSIQEKLMNFYHDNQEAVLEHVIEKYGVDRTDQIQLKTAKSRVFDILRSFLPAGCTTQLSWFTTFDNANKRLIQLKFHPLQEVRDIADKIIEQCKEQFPYAFSGIEKSIEKYGSYYQEHSVHLNYLQLKLPGRIKFENMELCGQVESRGFFGSPGISWPSVDNRPKGLPIPRKFSYLGRFQFSYLLDYGSFRDLQRHRNCVQMLPVLNTDYGFHPWYFDQLPKSIKHNAKKIISEIILEIEELELSEIEKQYYVPMGFLTPCELDCDLPQLVYISELRTNSTVHPTLRELAKHFADVARKYVPIFDDSSDDSLNFKRGTQDILQKS